MNAKNTRSCITELSCIARYSELRLAEQVVKN